MINKDRVQQAINVMERAGVVNMLSWQHSKYKDGICSSESELHQCGNTACFAGWLAISPEFRETGGKVGHIGEPVYNGQYGVLAVLSWFEATGIHEKVLELLVVGESFDVPEAIKEWFDVLGYQLITSKGTNRSYVIDWSNWEAEQVVDVLTNLLELGD